MTPYTYSFSIFFPLPWEGFVVMITITGILCLVWLYKWVNSLVTGSGGS